MIPVGALCYVVDAEWRGRRTAPAVLGTVVTVTGYGPCQCGKCWPGDNDRVCTVLTANGEPGCIRTWAALRQITPPAQSQWVEQTVSV